MKVDEDEGQQVKEEVAENVTDWVTVKRKTNLRTQPRTQRGKQEEEGSKRCRAVQTFVKVEAAFVEVLYTTPHIYEQMTAQIMATSLTCLSTTR